MSKNKELVKNTTIVAVGRLSTQFLSFLLLPLFTKYLTSEDYGIVDLITTYVALLYPIITISLDMAAFRLLIDDRFLRKRTKSIVSTAFNSVALLCIVSLVVYFGFSVFLPVPYGCLSALMTISIVFSNLFMQICRGVGDNKSYAIASIVAGSFIAISNILFIVFLGFGGESIIISTVLGNTLAFLYLLLFKKIYLFIELGNIDKKILREMVRYSAPLVPNGASIWVLNAASRTIVAYFIGVSATGIFAVSSKFPAILTALGSIFGMTWTESASLYINLNKKDRDTFFSNALNYSFLFLSSFALIVITGVSLVFKMLVGQSFQEAHAYIPLLTIGALLAFMNQNYGAIYLALKKSNEVLKSTIIAAAVTLIGALVMVPFFGLWGASISGVLGYLTVVIYRFFDLSKYTTIEYRWRDGVFLVFTYAIVLCLYHINSNPLNAINFIISLIVFIKYNKTLILKIIEQARRFPVRFRRS